MKRLSLILVLLFTASTLFAGGKECNQKTAGKSVELNGTIVRAAGAEKAVFRVADSNKSYTVCEQTKSAILKLADDGRATLHVKGKVVQCGEGEELFIEEAKKI